ncbi:MAG: ABC transporter substrate-binding protein, partial [Rhodocyclaceae bacterium]|nr:ABC transporter substrate-binding protein [Rhodocyclaceae bacterium]
MGLGYLRALCCVLLLGWLAAAQAAEAPEKSRITIAVGGKHRLSYLPLTLADRLGYFRQEGLDVTIVDYPAGEKALQALAAGRADMVSGAFEHAVQMHARGRPVKCVVVQGRRSGLALGLSRELAARYKSPRDLKGLRIGVTAPGSSSHMFVNVLLAKDGLKPDAVSIVAVGDAAGAVAAMQKKTLDAIANPDPVINLLEVAGSIVTVADTRSAEGGLYVYGADYPSGVMFASTEFIRAHPRAVQAVVNATLRALRWMRQSTPEQILAAVPHDYYGDARATYGVALRKNLSGFSPDGRMSLQAAHTVYRILQAFDLNVKGAPAIDLE